MLHSVCYSEAISTASVDLCDSFLEINLAGAKSHDGNLQFLFADPEQ